MLQLLDSPLHFIATPLYGIDLLRQVDQALVLHNPFDVLQAPFEVRQLDQYRILGLWLQQLATAQGKQQHDQQ